MSTSLTADTPVSGGSAGWDLGLIYRLIGELLLNPAVRDSGRVDSLKQALSDMPIRDLIDAFLAQRAAHDVDEYTQTLELTPPCPLYLGAHLYEEPNSCRGAGACGRNQYMIELGAIYEHFGFGLANRELPDFLPVMVEFLAVSLDNKERDTIGLRRRLFEHYLMPGIPRLRKALQKYESVYDLLLQALEISAEEDLERMADDPIWLSPEVQATIPVQVGTTADAGLPTFDRSIADGKRL
jgi:nitrate reductase delta subunit